MTRNEPGQLSSLRLLATMTLLSLLALTPGLSEEAWGSYSTHTIDQVQVQILNWELTRDRKTLLVHAKLQSQSKTELYFDWRSLLSLRNSQKDRLRPNYDALVDRNGAGLTRTVGEFRLEPGEKVRITIPFLLGEDDLPGRLELPDGRLSKLIR
jgi:hypothetical protein